MRDKDAVNAAFLICEMFAWYKTANISLLDRLNALYAEYGYCLNTLHSYAFEGASGFDKMRRIMAAFRQPVAALGGVRVQDILDYLPGRDGLPKSDVIKFLLADGGSVVIRPSGTEPKMKAYISVSAPDRPACEAVERRIADDLKRYFE